MDEPRRWRHILISLRLREVLPRVSLSGDCGSVVTSHPGCFSQPVAIAFSAWIKKWFREALVGPVGRAGRC